LPDIREKYEAYAARLPENERRDDKAHLKTAVSQLTGSRVLLQGTEVRCGHCGGKVSKKATRNGTLSLSRFVGRTVRAGDTIEIRVTMGRQDKGRFRYGAIGKFIRYPVTSSGLGKRVLRCLNPGSRKPVKCR